MSRALESRRERMPTAIATTVAAVQARARLSAQPSPAGEKTARLRDGKGMRKAGLPGVAPMS